MAMPKRKVIESVGTRAVSAKPKQKTSSIRTYDENRANFPAEELRKYDGQWIAFSADGRRIVASAEDLDSLEDLLAAKGQDPEKLTFERVESASYPYLGAAELH